MGKLITYDALGWLGARRSLALRRGAKVGKTGHMAEWERHMLARGMDGLGPGLIGPSWTAAANGSEASV